jgi:tRNA A-37 threonylcarbamoyl transferase component Bud32
MSYIKHNVSYKEFMMHEYIYHLSLLSKGILNVPIVNDYDVNTHVMTMENIPHMCVSDFYGEDSADISPYLFTQVREVVRYLYDNHIIYPDITGYNFIECEGKLWIIDFEHSDFKTFQKNIFVEEFVHNEDYNKWNPYFA